MDLDSPIWTVNNFFLDIYQQSLSVQQPILLQLHQERKFNFFSDLPSVCIVSLHQLAIRHI